MRLSKFGLLAVTSRFTHGYLDTSPFFVSSTSELLLSPASIQSGSKVTTELTSALSRCPSDFYLLINQPGVGVSDFATSDSSPTLSKLVGWATHTNVRSSSVVPEVLGGVDIQSVEQLLNSGCGAQSTAIDPSAVTQSALFDAPPQVLKIDFPAVSASQPERAQDLLDHDGFLASLLDLLGTRNYTMVYTTTPQTSIGNPLEKQKQYAMSESEQPLHTDLKRDIQPKMLKSASNQTLIDGPLFEKYQFLSPGLFMGLLVGLLLLSILYVAISAIASLQVSYAAFDKENGPSAQKKAQ